MLPTATSQEMRTLDRRAAEEYAIPTLLLMENAGRGATDALESELAPGDRVAVVCGKGNNGGDGFVIARHLHNRGYRPSIHLVADRTDFFSGAGEPAGDAGVNLRIIERMGIPIEPWSTGTRIDPEAALVVDALLGTGLAGDVREPVATVIRAINDHRAPVVAVDIPSGLDADTGRTLGVAVAATLTTTFGLPKAGFSLADGPDRCGRVVVVDISIPIELLRGEA